MTSNETKQTAKKQTAADVGKNNASEPKHNVNNPAALICAALLLHKGYPIESALETTKYLMGRVNGIA